MKIQQMITLLACSALLLFPGMARAEIDIRTDNVRVITGSDGSITINTSRPRVVSTPNRVRSSLYNRPSRSSGDLPNPRSSCHGINNQSQRTYTSTSGNGQSYTYSSTVTRVCR